MYFSGTLISSAKPVAHFRRTKRPLCISEGCKLQIFQSLVSVNSVVSNFLSGIKTRYICLYHSIYNTNSCIPYLAGAFYETTMRKESLKQGLKRKFFNWSGKITTCKTISENAQWFFQKSATRSILRTRKGICCSETRINLMHISEIACLNRLKLTVRLGRIFFGP